MQLTQRSDILPEGFQQLKPKGNVLDQGTTISVVPILNDPQYLQCCAVHTINNLLQITNDATIEAEEDGGDRILDERRNRLRSHDITRMILVNGELYTQSKIDFASKKELNTIADEMSNREIALMNSGEDSENSEMNEGITFRKLLQSNHRTLFTGNYSYEVLEAALSKRNISLEWFDVGSENPLHLSKDCSGNSSQIVIGYVINTNQIKPYSFKSIVRHAFPSIFSGRHWSIVTKIRVVHDLSPHDRGSESVLDCTSSTFIDSVTGQVIDYGANHWYIIDSKSCNTRTLTNDKELLEFFKTVKENDGNVFQAVVQTIQNFIV